MTRRYVFFLTNLSLNLLFEFVKTRFFLHQCADWFYYQKLWEKNMRVLYLFYHPFCLNIRIDINSLSIFFTDDCPNCVDEHSSSLAASRWTMPLLKLGEKRYYLGIFFKVSLLPVTLIYLTEPSTRPGSRTLSNYFQARNFPALLSRTVLRCIECRG